MSANGNVRRPEEIDVARRYGKHLQATRKALKVTAAELAFAVDVVPASVSAWECGRTLPTFYNSWRIRKYLLKRARQSGIAVKTSRLAASVVCVADGAA